MVNSHFMCGLRLTALLCLAVFVSSGQAAPNRCPAFSPDADPNKWTWMDADCVIRPPTDLSLILRRHKLWVKKHRAEIEHALSGKTAMITSDEMMSSDAEKDPLRADLHDATLIGLQLDRFVDLTGADLSGSNLAGADLSYSILIEANLQDATLTTAHLWGADLTGARLYRDKLYGAQFDYANLTRADLSNADLTWASLSNCKLKGASLFGANLSEAYFRESDLSEANLTQAKLWNTFFEPNTLPPIGTIARADGLETLRWWQWPSTPSSRTKGWFVENPYPILDLRKALHDAGYRSAEAKVNLAYFRRTQKWWQVPLFDWTCAWGVDWARPIWIVLALAVFCSALYWILLRRELCMRLSSPRLVLNSEVYKRRSRARRRSQLFVIARRNGRERKWPVGRNFGPMPWLCLPRPRCRRWFGRLLLDLMHSAFARLSWEIPLFLTAGLFSIMSVLNLGVQGLDLGRWFRLLHTRDFDLRARGSIRLLAGVQSVVSFLLLGLSAYNLLVGPIGE
jgi:uncharacterized protein YjbI with pentapeptide repeats